MYFFLIFFWWGILLLYRGIQSAHSKPAAGDANQNPPTTISKHIYMFLADRLATNSINTNIQWIWSSWFFMSYQPLLGIYSQIYFLNIYQLYTIWFGLSTIIDYLIPNPLYTYLLNTYDLVCLEFMAYQPL